MTTLEYFMAHAPAEPHEWFEPVMQTKPPIGPTCPQDEEFQKANLYWQSQYDGDWGIRTHLEKWNGDRFELTKELKDRVENYHNDSNDNQKRVIAYVNERAKQRLVQWPCAWAKEMLIELERAQGINEGPTLTSNKNA